MLDNRCLEILSELEACAERTKANFDNSIKVTGDPNTVKGIRIPLVRKAISQLTRHMTWDDAVEYLYPMAQEWYEYKLLFAGVAGRKVSDLRTCAGLFDRLFECVDGWASCDFFLGVIATVCHKKKEYTQLWLEYVSRHQASPNPFARRLTIVPMMKLVPQGDVEIDLVLSHFKTMQQDRDYYVSIAVAWSLATLYLSSPEKITDFIRYELSDPQTLRLTIRKMKESKRIVFSDLSLGVDH